MKTHLLLKSKEQVYSGVDKWEEHNKDEWRTNDLEKNIVGQEEDELVQWKVVNTYAM